MSEHAAPQRFPWRVTALIALLVIVASVVTGLLLGRDRVDSAPTTTTSPTATSVIPSDQDRQLVVLLNVRGEDGVLESSVLLGVGGSSGTVSELMLPRALLVPTVPPMTLSQTSDPSGGSLAAQPLQTLLGVQIDAVVDLDRLAWGGLIDATGTRVDPAVAKQPGSFGLVLDRVLAGLPPDAGTTSELLIGLGSMARTTVTNEDAGRVLALLGRDLRAHEADRAALPVTYVRAGDARAAVVKRQESDLLVGRLFPDAALATGHDGPLRVVVQRAGATVGAELVARSRLNGAGFGVISDRTSPVEVASTQVVVPDASEAAVAGGQQVAAALGLPVSSVVADTGTQPFVDVRVLLGPDATVGTP